MKKWIFDDVFLLNSGISVIFLWEFLLAIKHDGIYFVQQADIATLYLPVLFSPYVIFLAGLTKIINVGIVLKLIVHTPFDIQKVIFVVGTGLDELKCLIWSEWLVFHVF